MKARRPIVGVIGSAEKGWENEASQLGAWLAKIGVHLLTGGGDGVMASVSRAFYETSGRKGLVIGVLPASSDDRLCSPKKGYPNPWVELPIVTHLPLTGSLGTDQFSRNHIIVLSSDAVVALPGGPGTQSELVLAQRYHRPVIAFFENEQDFQDLPDEIPVAKTLSGIRNFLKHHQVIEHR